VAVDQLRGDLLTRYDALFTGGIRRLLDEGLSFTNTTHDHAETATAPGHATLATGVIPRRHGIAGNSWYEKTAEGWRGVYGLGDPDAPLLADPELPGRSPVNLRRDGIADWVRAADPEARVVSISRKDRSAIAMGGRAPAHVYWLSLSNAVRGFTTSTFYMDALPAWVEDANAGLAPVLWSDSVWETTASDDARTLARPDALATEGDGVHTVFPHRAWEETDAADEEELGDWLESTPYTDAAVFRLAEAALEALELGARGRVDFLALGLSSTDGVGHPYGPLSQEQLDNLLRLDRELGTFMERLDATLGPEGWAMALSGDHGVLEMVEWRRENGLAGHRITDAEEDEMERLAEVHGDDPEALAEALEELDVVADAMPLDELRGEEVPADSMIALFHASHVEGRVTGPFPGTDVVVRFTEGTYGSSRGTGHGAPYHYDRWVPFIVVGPGIDPGVRSERAATMDVAPTLARLGGVPVPDDLDGMARIR
jgi:predicted AlkP superfamily pyrophosphatase or phosphodiesterase